MKMGWNDNGLPQRGHTVSSVCTQAWEGLPQHILAIALAEEVKGIAHIACLRHHRAESSLTSHAGHPACWRTGNSAAGIPQTKALSRVPGATFSSSKGEVEPARPLWSCP